MHSNSNNNQYKIQHLIWGKTTMKRNANNNGTIRKKIITKNGKTYTFWEGRLTIGYTPNGNQKQKSFTAKTQADVIQKMNAAKVEIDNNDYCEPTKITVKQWLENWLDNYCVDVKFRSKEEYRNIIEKQIIPELGAKKLAKLSCQDVQVFCNNLKNLKTNKPLSAKRIKDIYACLRNAMQTAVDIELIKKNPTSNVKLPKVKEKEIAPFDEKQIILFLDAIKEHKYEALFTVALFTGLRESEICGLSWNDINFKKNEITVRQQLQKQNGKYLIVDTKTDNIETIPVCQSIMDILRQQKKKQLFESTLDPILWNNEFNLVFTNENGRYIIPHVVYLNFKKIAESINLPEARFHDLRHSCATTLLANNVDLKTVSKVLRHSNVATTTRYVHATSEMMKNASNMMDDVFQRVKEA